MPFGSGEDADMRTVGPSTFLYQNSADAEIAGGLLANRIPGSASDVLLTTTTAYHILMPKWQRW